MAQRHLASLLSNKLKREYLEMCGFVRACVSLTIERSSTLFSMEPGIRRHTFTRDLIWRMEQ